MKLFRSKPDKEKEPAKPTARPVAWKNTYFWIATLLVIVGLIGLAKGEGTIRDPGQRPEAHLGLWYLAAAALMAFNGALSHRLTLQHYEEEKD